MKKQEKIEAYLDGTLTGKDLEEFETALKTDENLAEEVELERKIIEVLGDPDTFQLREQLDRIYNKLNVTGQLNIEPPKTKVQSIKKKIKKWHYAAAILILIATATLLFFILRTPINERLYSENYKPFNISGTVRSKENPGKNKFDYALDQYNSGNYEEAFEILKETEAGDSLYMLSVLLAGISAMEINKTDEAINCFGKIIKEKAALYIEQAEWYSALCFLKKNEMKKAGEIFKRTASGKGYYRDKAKAIYEEIKADW